MADYFWTKHALYKMKQYALSEQKVRSVMRKPFRIEEGIVKNTIAVMIPAGKFVIPKEGEKPNWKQELWVMFVTQNKHRMGQKYTESKKLKIISAWRYPGVSPKNNPIPEEILREVSSMR